MTVHDILLSRWEDDEYIVEIGGNPVGSTVTKATGDAIVAWLESDQSNISSVLHEVVLGV